MNKNSKKEVLEKLELAATQYYNNKEPTMTDYEYDDLYEYAKFNNWINEVKLNDNAEIKDAKVKHDNPMLSLQKAKTKDDLEKYFNYIRKFNKSTSFVVEPKLDGIALTARYEFGTLKMLASRGNSVFGEDLTYLLDSEELVIKNLFKVIPDTEITEIRGELLCTREMFIKNNKNKKTDLFKNERNAVAGLVKKTKLGLGYHAELMFIPYFAYNKDNRILLDTIYNPAHTLFPENNSKTLDELMNIVNLAKNWRLELRLPTDGVVIKPVEIFNTEEPTEHHPKEFIAYKYPGETKQSIIQSVIWGIGRTGKLTPVAQILPVEIGGVEISNVTLHNLEWFRDRDIRINSKVEITRANDVIPAIINVSDIGTESQLQYPKTCPCCNAPTKIDGKFVYCTNNNCADKEYEKIKYFSSKSCLDIDRMNDAVIRALKLKNVNELISVDFDTLKNVKYDSGVSLGETRAAQIFDNIQKAKNNTDEYKWLVTLEFPNLANQTAKIILNHYKSIGNFLNTFSVDDIQLINGIGKEMAKSIQENIENAKLIWAELKNNIIINKIKETDNLKTFCVTGSVPSLFKNRDAFVEFMENKGYTFHSSIKKETKMLITDDSSKNSSKIKFANKHKIKIIKFEQVI